ncbi:MAG: sigma-70 family RNA polymerase sigma factor, partial [Chloroflexi bacterium]|nr:sigma-70 family RNA polymerase sigma factor [Chloroflexota bacterium]
MQAIEGERIWDLHHQDRDPDARERLIVQYSPLVRNVARRMAVNMPGLLSLEDVLGYGTLGLIQAVDRFDPSLGVEFEAFAIRRIRGSIVDAIRGLQQRSRGESRRARALEQAYCATIERLGRMPDTGEIAEYLGLTVAELRATLADVGTAVVSLSSPFGDADGDGERPSLIDQIADDTRLDVSTQVERQQLYNALAGAIEELAERDQLLLSLHYHDGQTFKDIAQLLGLSPSRVSDLHARALTKLRRALWATERAASA